MSNNAALRILYCEFNQLKTLDVSHNTRLGGFDCGYNRLTALDVSNNKEPKEFGLRLEPVDHLGFDRKFATGRAGLLWKLDG